MLCKCSTGLVALMKKLIERMPDVVVVGDERAILLSLLYSKIHTVRTACE